jgi:hypothetical protein
MDINYSVLEYYLEKEDKQEFLKGLYTTCPKDYHYLNFLD